MDNVQLRAAKEERLNAQRIGAIEGILYRQAIAIDGALADIGLAGRVTSGDVTGNEHGPTHARHLWEPSGIRPTMQQVSQIGAALPGAEWHYKAGGKLEITLPLEGDDGRTFCHD